MQLFNRKLQEYSASCALEWCIAIAQALDFLHTSSPPILHRDIKLDNLMLSQESKDALPKVKLVDFGLARKLNGAYLLDPQLGSTSDGGAMDLTEQTGDSPRCLWSYECFENLLRLHE